MGQVARMVHFEMLEEEEDLPLGDQRTLGVEAEGRGQIQYVDPQVRHTVVLQG